MVKIHQHVKFQANPSMQSPANARKPLRTDGRNYLSMEGTLGCLSQNWLNENVYQYSSSCAIAQSKIYYVCMWLVIRILVWEILNSSRSSAAYMCRFVKPSQVRIMTCRLFGAKSLSEPAIIRINADSLSVGHSRIHFIEIWIQLKQFSLKKNM